MSSDVGELQAAADSGDIEAQLQLGKIYTETNPELSKQYYKLAAENGNPDAQIRYGDILTREGDLSGAFEQYKQASSERTEAMLHVARMLKKGRGVAKNCEEAARIFKEIADSGHGYAQYEYGDCLKRGIGVKQNEKEAAEYFKESTKNECVAGVLEYAEILSQGTEEEQKKAFILYKKWASKSPIAIYQAARCLSLGIGTEPNLVQAARLFRTAAEKNVSSGAFEYGLCLENGRGVPEDLKEAAEWFKKAAELGHAKGMYKYGMCLKNGRGVKKNLKEGLKEIEKAAEAGYARAMVEFGRCCGAGVGGKRDTAKAAEWYRRAGKNGDREGLCRYGMCLEFGSGVECDLTKAEKVYSKAMEAGSADAQFLFGRILEKKGDIQAAWKCYQGSAEKQSPFGEIWYEAYRDNQIIKNTLDEPGPTLLAQASEKLHERLRAGDLELQLYIDEIKRLRNRTPTGDVSDLIIDGDVLETQRKLGAGAYGTVSLVRNKATGELWAAKSINENFLGKSSLLGTEKIMSEVKLLNTLEHPCILGVKALVMPSTEQSEWAIVTEYMENGTIAELLEKVKEAKDGKTPEVWTHTNVAIIVVGIVLGMRHIHRKSVLHRDLKPSNILLSKEFHPRIGDFGLSRMIDLDESGSSLSRQVGTPAYMAPEMCKNVQYTNKVDVFSFGLILFELLTGHRAFSAVSLFDHIADLVKGVRPAVPDEVVPNMRDLIKACWSDNPDERPSFSQIFKKLHDIDFKIWDDVDSSRVKKYVADVTYAENQIKFLDAVCDD